MTVALAWLQSESHVRAAAEIGAASRSLAAGEDGQLVTGSIDPAMVAVASEFNTASRRVGADRRASSERYRALFDGASDAILLVDPTNGHIVEASGRAERLFASPRHELVGRPFASCLDAPTGERLLEFDLAQRDRAEVSIVNAAILRADGTTIPVDASIALVAAGSERVLQAILRDVRDRLRIEHELRKAARRFEELYRLAVVIGDDSGALADHTVGALTAVPSARSRVGVAEADIPGRRGRAERWRRGRATVAATPCAEVVARALGYRSLTRGPLPDDRALVQGGVRVCCGCPSPTSRARDRDRQRRRRGDRTFR